MKSDFYVYIIFRPNGIPCYVGKGRGSRWKRHERKSHNPHLAAIIGNAGGELPKIKIRENLTNKQACEIEISFIAAIGREIHGGLLVNQTDGGEGGTGTVWSEEARERKRVWFREQDHTKREEARLKVLKSPEHRAKMSAIQKGIPKSPQGRANIASGARRGIPRPPEVIEKIRAGNLGKKKSVEARANMRVARIKHLLEHGPLRVGKKHSTETCANIAAHSRVQFAKKRWTAACPIFPSEFAEWGDGASAGLVT